MQSTLLASNHLDFGVINQAQTVTPRFTANRASRRFGDLNRAADTLYRFALTDILRRYGNDSKGGEIWLPYHNADHSRQVHDVAVSLAKTLVDQGRISPDDVPLVRIAAIFHDFEQLQGSGENERQSAAAAEAAMRTQDGVFSEMDILKVREMILGTTFDQEKKAQSADGSNLLVSIIADADLAAAGLPNGCSLGIRLIWDTEMISGRLPFAKRPADLVNIPLPTEVVAKHFKGQEAFYEHRYLLDISQERFRRGVERNAEFGRSLAASWRNGASPLTLLDRANAYGRSQGWRSAIQLGIAG